MYYVVGNNGVYLVDPCKLTASNNIQLAHIFTDQAKASRCAKSIYKIIPDAKCIGITIKAPETIKAPAENVDTYITEITNISNNITNELINEVNKLSDYDMKISDILHYIEINSFNACEGYKLCKMLAEYRKKRRDTKYRIDKLQKIQTLINSTTIDDVQTKVSQIEQNNQYSPRKLPALFNNKNFETD